MKPTDEQQVCCDVFDGGLSLAIEAGAGTGKTATLQMIGERTGMRGQYVAFNAAIVGEAKRKMSGNVSANTAHSLAMRAIGHRYRHRLGGARVSSVQLANMLDIPPRGMQVKVANSGFRNLSPGYLAGLAMRTVRNFCFSADPAPHPVHVPYIDGIDMPTDKGERTHANNKQVSEQIMPAVAAAWADYMDPEGTLPRFAHDHYLKAHQLSEPRINADFILLDEAQDMAPVMLDIVRQQEGRAQLVFVGDSQQMIYQWRGAVNAMGLYPADGRCFLTQSFRFGQPIADVANVILELLGAELRLVGNPAVSSQLVRGGPFDAYLTRTNAQAVSALLSAQKTGRRAHLVGGGTEVIGFMRGAKELKEYGQTGYFELACFDSWGGVQDYVETDPQGDELKLLVSLVDEFGVDAILDGLESMPDEAAAELVISTAHKGKGRQWPRVRLAGDFPDDLDGTPEEWRLLYVACTRAQETLDIRHCGVLMELLYGLPPAEEDASMGAQGVML